MTHNRSTPGDRSSSQEGALSDELLQRYFDEALSPSERAEVETRLDADARLRPDALTGLRGLLREHSRAEASGIDLSSTIDAIAQAALPTANPVPSQAAHRRRTLLPLSAAGGFLAAAVAVFMLWQPLQLMRGHQTNEAEVESLEVQGAIATVFRVEDGADPSHTATVIWTDDEEGAAGTDAVQGEDQE